MNIDLAQSWVIADAYREITIGATDKRELESSSRSSSVDSSAVQLCRSPADRPSCS